MRSFLHIGNYKYWPKVSLIQDRSDRYSDTPKNEAAESRQFPWSDLIWSQPGRDGPHRQSPAV
jgi:hypothetical protein